MLRYVRYPAADHGGTVVQYKRHAPSHGTLQLIEQQLHAVPAIGIAPA